MKYWVALALQAYKKYLKRNTVDALSNKPIVSGHKQGYRSFNCT